MLPARLKLPPLNGEHKPEADNAKPSLLKLPPLDMSKSYEEESNIHSDIRLLITLPNGTIQHFTVKIGETVSQLKRKIAVENKFQCKDVQLWMDSKPMMDPLSLNDFPHIVKNNCASIQVVVAGMIQSNGHGNVSPKFQESSALSEESSTNFTIPGTPHAADSLQQMQPFLVQTPTPVPEDSPSTTITVHDTEPSGNDTKIPQARRYRFCFLF